MSDNLPKTAVEWLVDFFESGVSSVEEWTKAKEQAKAMEKDQIVAAVDGFPLDKRHLNGEDYYKENYGKA